MLLLVSMTTKNNTVWKRLHLLQLVHALFLKGVLGLHTAITLFYMTSLYTANANQTLKKYKRFLETDFSDFHGETERQWNNSTTVN